MTAKPPVQCGNCGAEITFVPGQLVGDSDAVAVVKRYREALEKIAKLDLPYRDRANRARHLARKALDA